ncbi:MAG: hypothetical protein IID28_06695 [Planctomycetes bacterium]|nr:hypothetical protein [Planctomycetota bacterium]
MTPTDATFLLKRLEPAVRPSYFGPGSARPSAPLEQQPFEELLAAAKAGRLASGRSVSGALESGEALEPSQLKRLAAAADVAEASGAQRAVLFMDGRALVLDVPARSIDGELSMSSPSANIDAAVYVPAEGEHAEPRPLGPPGAVAPRAVAEQFEAGRSRSPTAA